MSFLFHVRSMYTASSSSCLYSFRLTFVIDYRCVILCEKFREKTNSKWRFSAYDANHKNSRWKQKLSIEMFKQTKVCVSNSQTWVFLCNKVDEFLSGCRRSLLWQLLTFYSWNWHQISRFYGFEMFEIFPDMKIKKLCPKHTRNSFMFTEFVDQQLKKKSLSEETNSVKGQGWIEERIYWLAFIKEEEKILGKNSIQAKEKKSVRRISWKI